MCNRYSLADETALKDALFKLFGLDIPVSRKPKPRYNVAPREKGGALVVRSSVDGKPELASIRWGYVPPFDELGKYDATNARAKTAFSSGAWRSSVQHLRCVVPADGFYEFKEIGNMRQAYRVTLKGAGVFFMPGVYVRAHGRWPEGFAFFTTEPNQLIANYHDRQPVILADEQVCEWLKPGPLTETQFQSFMRQVSLEEFSIAPVSRYVNKVGNEGPECFEQVEPPAETLIAPAMPKPIQAELF